MTWEDVSIRLLERSLLIGPGNLCDDRRSIGIVCIQVKINRRISAARNSAHGRRGRPIDGATRGIFDRLFKSVIFFSRLILSQSLLRVP